MSYDPHHYDSIDPAFERCDPTPNLQDWIGQLTALGFDLVNSSAHTSRGDWNANHPMPQVVFLFQRPSDKRNVILKSYACNSNRWTTYATEHRGTKMVQRWGFQVRGSRELELFYQSLADQLK